MLALHCILPEKHCRRKQPSGWQKMAYNVLMCR